MDRVVFATGSVIGVFAWVLLSAAAPQDSQQGTQPLYHQEVQQQASREPSEKAVTKAGRLPQNSPSYVPPRRGAPNNRASAGARGPEGLELLPLVPNHLGLTTQAQPDLYWYISHVTEDRIDLTITYNEGQTILLDTSLTPLRQPGIQRIGLADHGVYLAPDEVYQWHVSVIPDPERRSRDLVASGTIARVTPDQNLHTQLAQADKTVFTHIYAASGLWYDAFATISDLITRSPQDVTLRQQRAALLKQVGLAHVASGDELH